MDLLKLASTRVTARPSAGAAGRRRADEVHHHPAAGLLPLHEIAAGQDPVLRSWAVNEHVLVPDA